MTEPLVSILRNGAAFAWGARIKRYHGGNNDDVVINSSYISVIVLFAEYSSYYAIRTEKNNARIYYVMKCAWASF